MSDSKDLRKRIDALRRPRPPGRSESSADVEALRRAIRRLRLQRREQLSQPIVYRRDIPRRVPAPEHLPTQRGRPIALKQAVQGVEVNASNGGKAYLVSTHPEEIKREFPRLAEKLRRALARDDSNLRRRLANSCGLENVAPEDALFVDLETTGLMGTPLFLIGTMVWEDGGFAVRQYLARDYSEEPAVISLLVNGASGKKLLVTFNGKTFDLPYTRLRAAANAIPFTLDAAHFDLLHECRRIWGDMLPDCKLKTLESLVCDRLRQDDILGEHIGEAYHAFVRSGNAAQIADIVRHNMLDLITMADLMVRFPDPESRQPNR